MLLTPSPCHKLSHLLGPPPPSSVTYFMDGPYAPCKDTYPPSRYDNNPRPVAPSALSAELSRVPPPRRRPSVPLGSLWPKSLTLPTSRGHIERKMPIGSQLRLLLRLMVISCLLYPLPFIYLELSQKCKSVVSNC